MAMGIKLLHILQDAPHNRITHHVCNLLLLLHRQIRVAVANCDVNQKGMVDYRSWVPLLSKLLLKAKASSSPCYHVAPFRSWLYS